MVAPGHSRPLLKRVISREVNAGTEVFRVKLIEADCDAINVRHHPPKSLRLKAALSRAGCKTLSGAPLVDAAVRAYQPFPHVSRCSGLFFSLYAARAFPAAAHIITAHKTSSTAARRLRLTPFRSAAK